MDLSLLLAASRDLPEPDPSWTVPAAVLFGAVALFALVRKIVFLAFVAALLAAGFIAYQSGAFDQWVDKGKVVIDNKIQTG